MKQAIDYLLVPGRGIKVDEDIVAPSLQTKLNALFAKELTIAGLVNEGVIFTGRGPEGLDLENPVSEARYMGQIACSDGQLDVPVVLLEERSTTSFENVLFSGAQLDEAGIDISGATIGVASSKGHAKRVASIGRAMWPMANVVTLERPQTFKDIAMEPALGFLARQSLNRAVSSGPAGVAEAMGLYRQKVNTLKQSPIRRVHSGL